MALWTSAADLLLEARMALSNQLGLISVAPSPQVSTENSGKPMWIAQVAGIALLPQTPPTRSATAAFPEPPPSPPIRVLTHVTLWLPLRRPGSICGCIALSRFKCRAVWLSGHSAICSGVPTATTRPPRLPPSGPRSMTQSACATTSRLCSITTTELPSSTNWLRMPIKRLMSARCSPVVGSSSTYTCPVLPNSAASFSRWHSPRDEL